jgi:hypothetical protein
MTSKAYFRELARKSLHFAAVVTDQRLADRFRALAAEYHAKAEFTPNPNADDAPEALMPPPSRNRSEVSGNN